MSQVSRRSFLTVLAAAVPSLAAPRLADVPLARLRDAALAARRGGVGYYRASNFVHVDVGRVRAW